MADIRHFGSSAEPDSSSVRFIFIGRLLGWKAVGLAVRAMAEARISGAELWIVGSGPEALSVKQLSDNLGINDSKVLGQAATRGCAREAWPVSRTGASKPA